ncbi:MAG TPA: anti-sigma factor [Actinomycetota bacterium]|nr:anti-sigma factor [Actinomycetota bacterium]
MSTEHEAAQEILAAHALHALGADEAAEAEALIARHLPYCAECRAALEGFQVVAGDLALAADSLHPPRTLAGRLRREVARGDRAPRRWTRSLLVGAAAAIVVAVLGWNFHLTGRVSDAELRQVRTTEVLATVSHPLSRVVPLSWERPAGGSSLAAAFVPGRPLLYIFGSVSAPAGHRVYQVWLARGDRFVGAGTFLPERGLVLLRIHRDPSGYDGMLITEESREGNAIPSTHRLGTASF